MTKLHVVDYWLSSVLLRVFIISSTICLTLTRWLFAGCQWIWYVFVCLFAFSGSARSAISLSGVKVDWTTTCELCIKSARASGVRRVAARISRPTRYSTGTRSHALSPPSDVTGRRQCMTSCAGRISGRTRNPRGHTSDTGSSCRFYAQLAGGCSIDLYARKADSRAGRSTESKQTNKHISDPLTASKKPTGQC